MDLKPRDRIHPNAKAVFEMIRTHAVQGMFGDPAHGGNTGWRAGNLCASPARGCHLGTRSAADVVPKSNMQSTYSMPLFKSTWKRR